MARVAKGERLPCPRCGNPHTVKYGQPLGRQRYLCRECHYMFTQQKLRGKPGNSRALALALYSLGLSLTAISKLLKVTVPTIHFWVQGFMDKNFLKPETAELVTIPLGELLKILPQYTADPSRPVVLVPIDDATGDVAGMVSIPAMEPGLPVYGCAPGGAREQEAVD